MKKRESKIIGDMEQFISSLNLPYESEEKNKIKKLCVEPINLAVIGEFSAGKSTFINHFLDLEQLLPTSILPKTAVITKIKYGEDEKIELITIKDGNTIIERITKEDLAKLQNAKDEQVSSFKEIVITKNSDILKKFTFIDTPGFNHNDISTETTRAIYKEVNIFIWLTIKSQAFTDKEKDELEIIKNLENKYIYFVVNQSDKNEDTDEEDIKKNFQENIFEEFKEKELYFISSTETKGKYKDSFKHLKEKLKNEILEKDIKLTSELIDYEFKHLKKILEDKIESFQEIMNSLNELKNELKNISYDDSKEDEIIEKIIQQINDAKKEKDIEFDKIEYKSIKNLLEKYFLEEFFDKQISEKSIKELLRISKDYIQTYKSKITKFIEEKRNDINIFNGVKDINIFIDNNLDFILENVDLIATKAIAYDYLCNKRENIILKEILKMDKNFIFKTSKDYLDRHINKLEDEIKNYCETLKESKKKINNFKWEK
ncbi:dynamin family protein [Aliarcobacter butzleri]|uniref:dynamin family protein n=1 Tax=Aliarcobacter butzleri TaxID=28197 RepID=UPI0021B55F70|nr:dynamin family protein [Aliarcobacter butzleri]MCT7574458.1 dynamin family protein [Aliarcobacter butzleri]